MAEVDPGKIETGEQLRAALIELFHEGEWAVQRLAAKAGLGAATVQGILDGSTAIPRTGTLKAFVRACGLDPAPWVAARSRAVRADKDRGSIVGDPRFGGRENDLAVLDGILAGCQGRPCVLRLLGVPGVGKTMLAEQWIARLRQTGAFSGEVLSSIDLRGFSAGNPLSRTDVVQRLLRRLEMEGDAATLEHDERAQLVRERLEFGSYVLLLDNVGYADQIRDILPKTGTSIVVITSRNPLDDLGALYAVVPHKVEQLLPEGSLEVFRRRLSQRGETELDLREHVAELCGHLPLALGIVASRLSSNQQLTFQDVADQLERDQLRALGGRQRDGDDGAANPSVVFSWSYDKLTPRAQRIYRLLTVRLGQGVDDYAVALTGDIGIIDASDVIGEFRDAGLIESRGTRFDIHDLLYDFARARRRDQDAPEGVARVRARLLHAYYGCVNEAFSKANRHNPMVDAQFLQAWGDQDGKQAVAAVPASQWFDRERANLVHLVTSACTLTLPPSEAPGLAHALFYFLDTQHHWDDWATVIEAGLAAAEALRDLRSQARLYRDKGRLRYVRVRDLNDQLRDPNSRDIDWHADVLTFCGEATEYLNTSAALYQQHGELADEAIVVQRELADVGLELVKLRPTPQNVTETINRYERVETAWKGSSSGCRDVALLSLQLPMGTAYRLHGDYERARECLDFARELLSSGRVSHDNTGPHLYRHEAALNEARGLPEAAIVCWEKAIDLFSDTGGGRLHRARALAHRGRLLTALNDPAQIDGARDSLQNAHELLIERHPGEAAVVQTWLDQLDQ